MWKGKRKLLREGPVPVPFCLPHIPYKLVGDWSRPSAVTDQWIAAWTMARHPCIRVLMFNKEYALIKQAYNCVLTQCGKTLLEKLTATHLIKKLPCKMGQGNSSEFRQYLGLLKPSAYLTTGNLSKSVNPVVANKFPLLHILPDHTASYTVGSISLPGVKRPGHGVDHPFHLAPRLIMSGSIPLLPSPAHVRRWPLHFQEGEIAGVDHIYFVSRLRIHGEFISLGA